MSEIRIVGPFHSPGSGYAKLTRAALRSAILAGFKVQAIESNYMVRSTYFKGGKILERRMYEKWSKKYPPNDIQKEEVDRAFRTRVKPDAPTLLIQFPDQIGGWHEYSQGPRLAWTMLESDRITYHHWLKGLFGCDLLMAPSRYVYDTFRREVPEIPCELVPLPVDERLFEGQDVAIGGRFPEFLFISVFNCRERKQWRMMMQAFSEEFGENESVGLIVRASEGVGQVVELANWLNPGGNTSRRIIVLREWLSDDSLQAWYKRSNAYVLPSAEGFGLPYVEAAYCGLPSIALDDGGAWDVVTNETGWRIPSERRQVIGNLPHVYDSKHLFPVPESFEAVRHAFRNCYNSNEDKGAVARRKALEQFSPQAVAPYLENAVQKAREAFKSRTTMWSIPVVPEWALMVGDGFGDAMACVGNVQELLKNSPETIGIVHYGKSKAVEEFLLEQPIIHEVRQVAPESDEARIDMIDDIGRYAYPSQRWLPKMLEGTGIKSTEVAETQVHWAWDTWPVYRPKEIRLTDESEEWAESKYKELGEFILVQPYSTSSVDVNAHWPHWIPFLRWLLSSTESTHRLVFCGLTKIPGLVGPNVIDLIGTTPSMQHVLALSRRAKGIITTCNGLANWAACKGLRALIAGNYAIPRKDGYWSRFMAVPSTKLMLVDTSLEKFKTAAVKFLEGVSK